MRLVVTGTALVLVATMAAVVASPLHATDTAGMTVYVGTAGCSGGGACGTSPIAPCCTLHQAAAVANAAPPREALVAVVVAPGLYNSSSCGVVFTRPVQLRGDPGTRPVVDCAGSARVFWTNDTVLVSDIVLTRGAVTASVYSVGDSTFGGGAVSVVWSTSSWRSAVFHNVGFHNNSVMLGVAAATAPAPALGTPLPRGPLSFVGNVVGGGAVSVVGFGDAVAVTVALDDCVFDGNEVSAVTPAPTRSSDGDGDRDVQLVVGFAGGGGALVLLGQGMDSQGTSTAVVRDSSVAIAGVASGNGVVGTL